MKAAKPPRRDDELTPWEIGLGVLSLSWLIGSTYYGSKALLLVLFLHTSWSTP